MNPIAPLPTIELLRDAFTRVYDPEFGVSIEDLGLIYDIHIEGGSVAIAMTLTTMYCPAGNVIVEGIKAAALAVPGVTDAEVSLVWEPQWTPERMSASAREQLGWTDSGR